MNKIINIGLYLVEFFKSLYLSEEEKIIKEEQILKNAIKEITEKHKVVNNKYVETHNGISFDESPMFVDLEGVYFDQKTKIILGYQTNGWGTKSRFMPFVNAYKTASYYAYRKYCKCIN